MITSQVEERPTDDNPDMRRMLIGFLIFCPVVFVVNAATTYRPSLDSFPDIALACLPFIMFAATMTAIMVPLRNLSSLVHGVAVAVALGSWTILMFDDGTWQFFTFILFGVSFGAGQWLGVVLSGAIAVVWSISWATSDLPIWLLSVPIAVFAIGSLLAVTIWRVENTKQVMRRNRQLESAYMAQEITLRQNEKLATLGKLSAGMAHELNNPTSAAQQAATQLSALMFSSELTDAELASLGLTSAEANAITAIAGRIDDRARRPEFLDPLERSDREAALQETLEQVGIDDAWEIAPSLVGLGLKQNELADLTGVMPPARLGQALSLLAAQHDRASLLVSLDESIGRVIEIVKALKTYTYLDQAPRQLIDVRDGLDTTLVMLQNRLKKGIKVNRSYAANLPPIEAFGSELNQVWTNLLDNAVDAMDGQGVIEIGTSSADGYVVVQLTDDGPGIPASVAGQIFDPFTTTKAPGKGTGLGLNISHNIITQKHGGEISFTSEPGSTTFTVRLPIEAPAELAGDGQPERRQPQGSAAVSE